MAKSWRWPRRRTSKKLTIRPSANLFQQVARYRSPLHVRGADMEKAKLELVVGVFVLIGLVCLGYVSIRLGKLEMSGVQFYEVEAEFDSYSALMPGAVVAI